VSRAKGGSDAASNLQLHHLNCHRYSHYAENYAV
jgi:hypothetical protein